MEFRDLKRQYQLLKPEIDAATAKVMSDADFISGRAVRELEEQLAQYVGVKHCITCANGTDALMLALMAWHIGAGDAVFVPDFTFFASGEAPAFLGATPVFVDVRRDTFNLDAQALEKAIQEVEKKGELRPRAIVAVDLFGQPADFDAITKLARRYGLLLLEDGAQGFGGKIGEKKACSFGDIGATSFFPAKPLGCYGDGGAVFTDNDEWAEQIRSYCVHGKGTNKYDNVRIGMNSRLDTLQAVILQVKFRQFCGAELKQVNQAAARYTEALKQLQQQVVTPVVQEGMFSSWAQYTIVCKEPLSRDELWKRLKEAGVPSMIYYRKGMHEQKAFEGQCILSGGYENTNYLKERVLSLPLHPYLDAQEIEYVTNIILKEAKR